MGISGVQVCVCGVGRRVCVRCMEKGVCSEGSVYTECVERAKECIEGSA